MGVIAVKRVQAQKFPGWVRQAFLSPSKQSGVDPALHVSGAISRAAAGGYPPQVMNWYRHGGDYY
jgi:hypothetical protein